MSFAASQTTHQIIKQPRLMLSVAAAEPAK